MHVSCGLGDAPKSPDEAGPWSDIMRLGIAVKKTVGIPVIGVGGIVEPDLAEAALAGGLVDLVAVGRGILADPTWARKALAGEAGAIQPCRHCRICHHFGHSERCPARQEAAEASAG